MTLYSAENVNLVSCRCSVGRFAREQIQPLVKEMDEKGGMPPSLIKQLHDNGVSR